MDGINSALLFQHLAISHSSEAKCWPGAAGCHSVSGQEKNRLEKMCMILVISPDYMLMVFWDIRPCFYKRHCLL